MKVKEMMEHHGELLAIEVLKGKLSEQSAEASLIGWSLIYSFDEGDEDDILKWGQAAYNRTMNFVGQEVETMIS